MITSTTQRAVGADGAGLVGNTSGSGTAGAASALRAALDTIGHGLDAVGVVDPADLHVDDLAAGTVALQRLGDRVQVALARLLAEAERASVWQGSGSRDAAGWLAGATHSAYGAAVDLLRLGDTLQHSASLADKVERGEMSADTAVALHRVVTAPPSLATAADVDRLVEMCAGASPNDARKAAEVWKDGYRTQSPEQLEAERFARRAVRFGAEVDGMVRATADLPTLDAHLLRKALTSVGGRPGDDDQRTTEQRLADALLQLADTALSATRRSSSTGSNSSVAPRADRRSASCRDGASSAHAIGDDEQSVDAWSDGDGRDLGLGLGAGTGRQRVDLLVTIDLESLVGHDDPRLDRAGVDEFGGRIPAHVVRRLAENASIERIVHIGGCIMDHGRAVRLATDAQYRALVARDGGCRWPGCDKPALWCEIDHLVPWSQGGRTDLSNMVLLCAAHHTEKHRFGTRIIGDADDLEIVRPDGVVMWCPPKGVAAGSAPPGRAAPPDPRRRNHSRLDVLDVVDVRRNAAGSN